jgi:hypothetical protein
VGWLRSSIARKGIALLLFTAILFAADAICYRIALPISLDVRDGSGTLDVGGQIIQLGTIGQPIALEFPAHNPLVHEYQIDGTDSTNNFTLDTSYLETIANTPYYRFQAWMRDLDGTSTWTALSISASGAAPKSIPDPAQAALYSLPASSSLHVAFQWQRPETPMSFVVFTAKPSTLRVTLDRNDRSIAVQIGNKQTTSYFFPKDGAPFAAMVADFLVRILLWAVAILLAVLLLDLGASVLAAFLPVSLHSLKERATAAVQRLAALVSFRSRTDDATHDARAGQSSNAGRQDNFLSRGRTLFIKGMNSLQRASADSVKALSGAVHPLGIVALALNFVYVLWIALVEYRALPHIYDASAYLFGAKIIASGQLSVPAPLAADRFPGPFMVIFDGRWFTQYEPGTSLVLALGVKFGVPWLVEPVLGTLALLGIGLIAAKLYNRTIATLAVILGTLSPFYSYLAASYLSHAIELFFVVYGFWFFLRFARGAAGWNLPLSAACFGIGFFSRDTAIVFGCIVVVGVLVLSWRSVIADWRRWIVPGAAFVLVILVFVNLYQFYNLQLTGDPLVTPRTLFAPNDRLGFGTGIGFYGQHTLAAGFVNVDELLTILAIDLYGWPFYLTLVFLALPFITLRARAADWLMLAGAAIMTGFFIGYFYHGIYLGPRFLFDALPFFLILTARGIVAVAQTGSGIALSLASQFVSGRRMANVLSTSAISVGTVLVVLALIACNLLYYTPRQIALYDNFTNLPAETKVNTAQLLHPPVHHAIIVTGNALLYGYTLFALNDPSLSGDVLYAYAITPDDFAELRATFPGRQLYQLTIEQNGSVSYVAIPASRSNP